MIRNDANAKYRPHNPRGAYLGHDAERADMARRNAAFVAHFKAVAARCKWEVWA